MYTWICAEKSPDISLLHWPEGAPPKLCLQITLANFPVSFFFFYAEPSTADMWIRLACPDPITYCFIHKHNQRKSLQRLQLDTKQTDIKMLRVFFFFLFVSIVIAHQIKSNMATGTGIEMWTYCCGWKTSPLIQTSFWGFFWNILVKYFFSSPWTVNEGL